MATGEGMMRDRRPVRRVLPNEAAPSNKGEWPTTIPAVAQVLRTGLELPAGVTLVVGENGTGKSTLVEAVAMAFGLAAEGGTRNVQEGTRATESPLHRWITLERAPGAPRWGFFLRAETMHGYFTRQESYSAERDPRFHEMSHGESFLEVLRTRFDSPGFYCLDEPEAALSFSAQLALVATLHDLAAAGAQVLCATHSPLLAAVPGARILEAGPWGIRETPWDELELVVHWRRYLETPMSYLRHVLDCGKASRRGGNAWERASVRRWARILREPLVGRPGSSRPPTLRSSRPGRALCPGPVGEQPRALADDHRIGEQHVHPLRQYATVLDSAPRSPRSLRGLSIYALVLAALVPAALWWVGHHATVHVSAATGIPHCDGTEPTTVRDLMSDFEQIAIPTTEGFVCTLTVRVDNRSDREVTLGEVTVPISGPRGGSSFRITHIGGERVPENDEVDAVSDLDRSVEAGDQALVDLRVTFRRSGCTSKGGSTWVDPTIQVEDLLASHDLTITDLPRFLGTADSSCDT
jgi:predicted ATPase